MIINKEGKGSPILLLHLPICFKSMKHGSTPLKARSWNLQGNDHPGYQGQD
jgi:hypothetical protein